jgi:hypothetical protein
MGNKKLRHFFSVFGIAEQVPFAHRILAFWGQICGLGRNKNFSNYF